VILKDHENKNDNMYEYSQSWRRRLRLQFLVDIARIELKSGKEFDEFSQKLDQEMQIRWKLVPSTRKQYLNTVRKVISNQFVLVH